MKCTFTHLIELVYEGIVSQTAATVEAAPAAAHPRQILSAALRVAFPLPLLLLLLRLKKNTV